MAGAAKTAIPFWKTAALPPVCTLRLRYTERGGSEVIHDREEQVAEIWAPGLK